MCGQQDDLRKTDDHVLARGRSEDIPRGPERGNEDVDVAGKEVRETEDNTRKSTRVPGHGPGFLDPGQSQSCNETIY
eukprot:5398195-Ditylum_brightwellii.AAC.1